MDFKNFLKDCIKKSNLSLREISTACKEKGVSITPSYISQIQNGKIKPPSEEILSVLADVLKVDYNLLLIESYLDGAPDIVKEFLVNIRSTMQSANNSNSKLLNTVLSNQPISKFILDFNAANFTNNNSVIGGIPFEDDSMEPLIPKGSKLIISKFKDNPENVINIDGKGIMHDNIYEDASNIFHKDEIGFLYAKDGDIIVAWDLDNNKLLVRIFRRSVLPEDDELNYYLIPINGTYEIKVGSYDQTYFNLAHIENQKTIVNNDLINVLNREFQFKYNDETVTIKKDSLGLCILGKVQSIITDLKI